MKKQTSKKKLVEQTVARLKEAQAATQEKVDAIFSGIDPYKPTDHRAVMGYLYNAAEDALDHAQEILPELADIKAHPLPALQDLMADPYSHRTIKDVTNEITYHHKRITTARKSIAPEDFYSYYQHNFLDAVQCLYEKKIAVSDTLGKPAAKQKLIEAFAALSKFTMPEEFKISFRRALMLDAEATDEINGATEPAAPQNNTKSERQQIVKLGYEIYTSRIWKYRKLKGDKRLKRISYNRAILILLDEPIPRDDPFYERTKEAREIVKKIAKGGDDAKIRRSLVTEIKNYKLSISPSAKGKPTIPLYMGIDYDDGTFNQCHYDNEVDYARYDRDTRKPTIVPNIGDASSNW